MRIGIDARMPAYRMGGISTYVRHLVTELAKIDDDNHYMVFQHRKLHGRLSASLPTARLWTPCHHRIERTALSVELAPHNLDVFHSPDFIPPRRGARRHIITVQDLAFLHYPQFMTTDSRRYYNDQIKWAVQHADHILTISEATKRDAIELLGVPEEKITVHLLGVSENFSPQHAAECDRVRAALHLPPSYFLFVGTFEPRKNLPGLLQAYRIVRDAIDDAPPLVLAGNPGWLYGDIFDKVEALHLTEHILWREAIAQADLPALYTMATALLMPSHYEGFGFPALEAMACGTVPIVSDRASLPEVVGDVGCLVDPDTPEHIAAAMQHALTHADWRTAQEAAAIERAAGFGWRTTAAIACAVYLME